MQDIIGILHILFHILNKNVKTSELILNIIVM